LVGTSLKWNIYCSRKVRKWTGKGKDWRKRNKREKTEDREKTEESLWCSVAGAGRW
jgi:hypothetical protein